MKHFKTIVALFVALMLLLTLQNSFAAQGNSNEIMYDYTAQITAELTISGSTASVYGSARGKNTNTTTTIVVTLQRKPAGGGSWASVFSATDTSNGRQTAEVDETYSYIISGFTYRVRTVCTIKDENANILEQVTKYSSTITV